jgi:hypothetical protein
MMVELSSSKSLSWGAILQHSCGIQTVDMLDGDGEAGA